MQTAEDAQSLKGFIIDLDGVVWRRSALIPGALETIQKLRALGKRITFLSNNSSESRDWFVQKLKNFGIDASLEEVIHSPYVTAKLLSASEPHANVFVVGMPGLQRELEKEGLHIVSKPEEAAYVVAGFDSNMGYEKLGLALKAILAGAKFVATNDDGMVPTEEGYMPGAGATIGAIKGMIKREPDLIVGKPNDYMLKFALKNMDLKIEECVFIGDSLKTDIMLANQIGMRSVLVMSGNTRNEREIESFPHKPDYIISSIADIPKLLLSVKEAI